MEGFLPIFFLLVVLKVPVLGALWLIWWASKAPQPEGMGEDGGGDFDPRRPQPRRPRGPEHGPDQAACGERRRLRSRRMVRR